MIAFRMLPVAGAAMLAVLVAPQANAQEVKVLGSCVATVPAGQVPELSPLAVQQPIVNLLTPLDPLDVLVPAFNGIWAQQPPIALHGSTGEAVATAVVSRLRGISLLSQVIDVLTPSVHDVLAATCGLTILPSVAPSVTGSTPHAQPPTSVPAAQSVAAASPVTVQPEYTVGGGYVIAAGEPSQPAVPRADGDRAEPGNPQLAAGSAEVIPDEPGTFGSPVVLAALLLTLVSTQLLRVWVLRRDEGNTD